MVDQSSKKNIASRGVPSKHTMYLPAHYSDEIRRFQDDNETQTRNLWNVSEVLNFIFPEKFQKKYYEIAISFLNLLANKLVLEGQDIAFFIKENNISKATFYNRVLPKLRRTGIIKLERKTVESGTRKKAPMRITISKTFGNYLTKIGESWLAIVDDARSKK